MFYGVSKVCSRDAEGSGDQVSGVFRAEEVWEGDKGSGDNKTVDADTLYEKSVHILDCVEARNSGL